MKRICLWFLAVLTWAAVAAAQSPLPVAGSVYDAVGRAVSGATVQLTAVQMGHDASGSSDAAGAFQIAALPGTYRVTVSKESLASFTTMLTVGAGAPPPLRVTLDLAPVQQSVVVTATGVPTPQTQLGQSVETVDRAAIEDRDGLTADDSLRELTGIEIVRVGAIGGLTSVMIRGGDPSFSKIMLDGVPVQRFDFGGYDFSTLTPEALDSITVVRGADSVVYGTDAASGVIDMRSRSGEGLAAPEVIFTSSAGSFDTTQESLSLLGGWRALDYGLTFGYLDTENQVPNNKDWNQSWSGNFGLRLPARIRARLNIHRIGSREGSPNAFGLFGIADDSMQRQGETYASLSLQQQTTPRWHNSLTLSQYALNYLFDTLAPTGQLVGGNYLGLPVTITGANGYSVQGQGILDYGGTYPAPFASDTVGRFAAAETSYDLAPAWKWVAGYRYGQEIGISAPSEQWHDNGVFSELSGGAWNRLFGSAGVSADSHSRFGNTVNPQASLAVLPRLQRGGWWDEIRLHANAATAQKDPNLTEDQSSLYQDAISSGGAASAASLHIGPVQPQRAHTFDAGIDQYLDHDRLRASLTWFDDRYYDLIQFVPSTAFGTLGLSAAATAEAQAAGGAYLNSWSESSKGVELEMLAQSERGWTASASYTYLKPVVLSSYSSDALFPSYNPAFPTIAIGAFSPLVGARPFHVAPESGTLTGGYQARRWSIHGNLYASSRRDDSTFLTDANFGTTLLLPNHDLAPAYAAVNLSGFYRESARVTWNAVVENALNRNYQETFGYPSLGRSARVGFSVLLTKPRN